MGPIPGIQPKYRCRRLIRGAGGAGASTDVAGCKNAEASVEASVASCVLAVGAVDTSSTLEGWPMEAEGWSYRAACPGAADSAPIAQKRVHCTNATCASSRCAGRRALRSKETARGREMMEEEVEVAREPCACGGEVACPQPFPGEPGMADCALTLLKGPSNCGHVTSAHA